MKEIKYTGYADNIAVYLDKQKFYMYFSRNKWKSVSDDIAINLLKDNHFISKEDYLCNLKILKTPLKLGIYRFGAMGDLIQLIPIMKWIKEKYKHKIILITQSQYVDFFRKVPEAFDEVYSNEVFHRNKYDKLVFLDGVMEMDHCSTNDESKMHRIKIIEQFFGISLDKYDFSFTIDKETVNYVEGLLDVAI